MTDNLKIWNAVSKTDPKHTKPVAFGARKFTSIDAHYQIMRMTEQFGPIGEGWGYEATHSIAHMGDVHLAVCDVLIWWQNGNAERIPCRYGPVRGTAELFTIGKRLDDDAPKKCLTDALTKGLSHLGLSADVFLGLFDDNKYVQKMAKEFADDTERLAPKDAPRDGDGKLLSKYDAEKATKAKDFADNLITVLNTATKDEARKVWTDNWKAPAGSRVSPLAWLETHAPEQYQRVSQAHENAVA